MKWCLFIKPEKTYISTTQNHRIIDGAEVGRKTVFTEACSSYRCICINDLVQIRAILKSILSSLGVGSVVGTVLMHKTGLHSKKHLWQGGWTRWSLQVPFQSKPFHQMYSQCLLGTPGSELMCWTEVSVMQLLLSIQWRHLAEGNKLIQKKSSKPHMQS